MKQTSEELLRQQLELLAELSANEASAEGLSQLTSAMVKIYVALSKPNLHLETTVIRSVIQKLLDEEQVLL